MYYFHENSDLLWKMSLFLNRGRDFCVLEPLFPPPPSNTEWNEPQKEQALRPMNHVVVFKKLFGIL